MKGRWLHDAVECFGGLFFSNVRLVFPAGGAWLFDFAWIGLAGFTKHNSWKRVACLDCSVFFALPVRAVFSFASTRWFIAEGALTGSRPLLQVECSTVEQVRRVVFSELEGLTGPKRALAVRITRALRAGGWLRSSVEECFEAGELGQLWGRSREWVVRTFYAAGSMPWGEIARDGGGWLIPASVAEHYLAEHVPTEKVAPKKNGGNGFEGGRKDFQKGQAGKMRGERLAAHLETGERRQNARRTDATTTGNAGLSGIQARCTQIDTTVPRSGPTI